MQLHGYSPQDNMNKDKLKPSLKGDFTPCEDAVRHYESPQFHQKSRKTFIKEAQRKQRKAFIIIFHLTLEIA